MKPELAPILVAEDEETDGIILGLAFERAAIAHPLVIVRDGQELVEYLTGTGAGGSPQNRLPCLILLDLKMPRMNGFDVLSWLSVRPAFQGIPTVVLSSSAEESDMAHARQLGARDYLVKPFGLPPLVTLVRELHARWLAALPPIEVLGARDTGAPARE